MNILIKLGNLLLKFLYNNVFHSYTAMVIVIPIIISIFTSKIDREYAKTKKEAKSHKDGVLEIKERYKGVPNKQVDQKIEEYYQSKNFDPIPILIKMVIATMVRISIMLSLINPKKFLTTAQLNSPNPFLGFSNIVTDEMSFVHLLIYVVISVVLSKINKGIEKDISIADIKINKESLLVLLGDFVTTFLVSSFIYWVFTKGVLIHIYIIALTIGSTLSLLIEKFKKGGDINE